MCQYILKGVGTLALNLFPRLGLFIGPGLLVVGNGLRPNFHYWPRRPKFRFTHLENQTKKAQAQFLNQELLGKKVEV